MSEPTPPTDRPDPTVCPWCSASVTAETVSCGSCGAVLITEEEPNLPGVTAVDAKVMRGERPPQRNRLLSWISGEYPEEAPIETDAHAIAPPDPEVQREIRRLEVEAETASLQAEADALLSEAVVEGRVMEVPEGIRPLALNEAVASPVEEGDASATDGEPVAGEAPAEGDTVAEGETAGDETTPAGESPAEDESPA